MNIYCVTAADCLMEPKILTSVLRPYSGGRGGGHVQSQIYSLVFFLGAGGGVEGTAISQVAKAGLELSMYQRMR